MLSTVCLCYDFTHDLMQIVENCAASQVCLSARLFHSFTHCDPDVLKVIFNVFASWVVTTIRLVECPVNFQVNIFVHCNRTHPATFNKNADKVDKVSRSHRARSAETVAQFHLLILITDNEDCA